IVSSIVSNRVSNTASKAWVRRNMLGKVRSAGGGKSKRLRLLGPRGERKTIDMNAATCDVGGSLQGRTGMRAVDPGLIGF
ncbi:MAG: hypothetical protein OSB70_17485, partial [Myxococcota bacterium]|nr:hypothetical protein [Myxococcota bacterium]